MNQPLGRDTLDAARAVLASARLPRNDFMAISVFANGIVNITIVLFRADFRLFITSCVPRPPPSLMYHGKFDDSCSAPKQIKLM